MSSKENFKVVKKIESSIRNSENLGQLKVCARMVESYKKNYKCSELIYFILKEMIVKRIKEKSVS
jgi:hypothetical protein